MIFKPLLIRVLSVTLGLGVSAACLPGCAPKAAPAPVAVSAPPSVEPLGDGRWKLSVERRLDRQSGHGQVIVKAGDKLKPEHFAHVRLAGGRAWLEVARALHAQQDWTLSLTAARAGMDELGPDWQAPGFGDDSAQTLDYATQRIQESHYEEGVRAIMDLLATRLEAYRMRHQTAGLE